MKKLNIEKCEDLSDVFCAVMGGRPESIREIEAFIVQSPLKELFFAEDLNIVINYDGFFADETIDAVYAMLPAELTLKDDKKWIMTPQTFHKLNAQKIQRPASKLVNISFPKAFRASTLYLEPKILEVIKLVKEQKQRKENAAKTAPAPKPVEKPVVPKKTKAQIEAEEKERKAAIRREKARLRMRKHRAEHPEARKSYYVRYADLSPEEREKQQKANRERNRVYREKNREKIRKTRNEQRAKMKQENPELLKEIDRQHNANANRKESCRRYYERHKQEVLQRTNNNPMKKVYNARYKAKKRLQQTAPIIASIVQGVLNSKISR